MEFHALSPGRVLLRHHHIMTSEEVDVHMLISDQKFFPQHCRIDIYLLLHHDDASYVQQEAISKAFLLFRSYDVVCVSFGL